MTASRPQKRDVVCGMTVDADSFPLVDMGIEYAFCSAHCRDRFLERPHLFIGDPCHGKAPRQVGKKLLKSHRIVLREVPSASLGLAMKQEVDKLMGIEHCSMKEDIITVVYDLLQVSLEDIERAVVSAHTAGDHPLKEPVKRAIIHFSEDCELDNLEHYLK